jgi:NADP-dependent 3-hydroxy acid dehydrogenase YdfG
MAIAIVTGASSGMGEEFCRSLDNQGLDCIWLVARRQDRLVQVASSLKTPARIFSVDLSDRA